MVCGSCLFTLSAFSVIRVVPGLRASSIALSAETFRYLHVIHVCGPNGQVLTRLEQVESYREGSFPLTAFPSSLGNLRAPVRVLWWKWEKAREDAALRGAEDRDSESMQGLNRGRSLHTARLTEGKSITEEKDSFIRSPA